MGTTNDIIEAQIVIDDTTNVSRYRNYLRYRAVNEYSDALLEIDGAAGADTVAGFSDALFDRFVQCMRSDAFISGLKLKRIWPNPTALYSITFASNLYPGTITELVGQDSTDSDKEAPQATAPMIKHSYQAGHKGLGKFLFGPLSGKYTERGLIVLDPVGVGIPSLQIIADALGDPIDIGVLQNVWKPCVVGNARLATVTANDDVRIVKPSARVCYLRTRRVGVGE